MRFIRLCGLELLAAARNAALVGGHTVGLEKDVSEVDRYGRLLRYVYLMNGVWVNGALVREGFARVTIYPPDRRYEARLYALQAQAQAEHVGGWAACGWSASW